MPSETQIMKTRQMLVAWAGSLRRATAASLPARLYTFSTLAGNGLVFSAQGYPMGGFAVGANGSAWFDPLVGIGVDEAGALFVANTLNHAIRQVRRGAIARKSAFGTGRGN